MPKMKSKSGAKKRLRRTGSGRIALKRNSRNHLLLQKGKRQKRKGRTLLLHKTELPKVSALVPYL